MPLTPRQLEYLARVADGWPTKQIAARDNCSVQRVKTVLMEARRRLGAVSTPHAIALLDDSQPGWRPTVEAIDGGGSFAGG